MPALIVVRLFPTQRFTDDQLEPGAAWPYLEAYAPYGFVRPPHASGSRVEDRRRYFLPGGEEQPESEFCWGQTENGMDGMTLRPTTHKRVYLFFHAVTPMLELGWRKFFFFF